MIPRSRRTWCLLGSPATGAPSSHSAAVGVINPRKADSSTPQDRSLRERSCCARNDRILEDGTTKVLQERKLKLVLRQFLHGQMQILHLRQDCAFEHYARMKSHADL